MSEYSEVVETAREYYNSDDADNFYATIWGGEDIHIGLYQDENDHDIFTASHHTVVKMGELLTLDAQQKVLDIGAGYGGTARYLAKTFGCQVVCLNLSEAQNERNRKLNQEQQLDHLITVVDGDFENIPSEPENFDVVISQDAILHSGHRKRVLEEVARVLKPGGTFLFTDPMQHDDCPDGVLDPILQRIHLDTLGSIAFYRQTAKEVGLSEVQVLEMTHQLVNHYSAVLRQIEVRDADLGQVCSREYIEKMKKGLGHWIEGGQKGYLAWGFLQFRKG